MNYKHQHGHLNQTPQHLPDGVRHAILPVSSLLCLSAVSRIAIATAGIAVIWIVALWSMRG